MVAAVDTEGCLWYSLSQGTGNALTFALYLEHLAQQMNSEIVDWASDTVFLLDNAAIHSAPVVKDTMARLGMKVAFTAPYSYSSSPCELVFAALKRGELNLNRLPTGKR